MADVLEDRRDLDLARSWLWPLMEATTSLDWLVLTKRPQNAQALMPVRWWTKGWPGHVWFGVTCGHPDSYWRIPLALQVPAAIHFVSAEPLLAPLDFTDIELPAEFALSRTVLARINCLTDQDDEHVFNVHRKVSWIVAGSESGQKARPMNEDWIRSLRNQCIEHGTAFLYKQRLDERGRKVELPELDGRTWSEFPA